MIKILLVIAIALLPYQESRAQGSGIIRKGDLGLKEFPFSRNYREQTRNDLLNAYPPKEFREESAPKLGNPFRDEMVYGPFRQGNSELWKVSFQEMGNAKFELWGISDHDHKGNKNLNEKNPGIGAKYFLDEQNFFVVAYINKNSQKGRTWFFGKGHRNLLLERRSLKLYLATAVIFMHYEAEDKQQTIHTPDGRSIDERWPRSANGPMGAIGFEFGGSGISLNATRIPLAKVTTYNLSIQKLFW